MKKIAKKPPQNEETVVEIPVQENESMDENNTYTQDEDNIVICDDNYTPYTAPHDKFVQGLFYCLFLNVFALWVCALMYEKRTKERLTFISGWVTCAFILFVFLIVLSIVVAYLLREGIIRWPWYW